MPTPLSAQGNEEFWATARSSYDSLEWQRKLTAQAQAFIREQTSWLGLSSPPEIEVKVLDYACGPGVVSLALLPYTTTILGLDVNPQQVQEFNRRSTGSKLPTDLIHAEEADLLLPDKSQLDPKFSEDKYNNFDYAFCSVALHHVDNPAMGVARLAERVKANGGKVVIIEFLERDIAGMFAAHGPSGSNPVHVGAGSEEERLKLNAEYRLHSHDNRHLEEGEKVKEQAAGHDHHHGHGHDHKHDHKHDHEHKHGHGQGGERKHGHGPHGFRLEQMEGWFKDAGLVDVESRIMKEKVSIMGFEDFECFMTQGRKE
ncbi:hypothetical protein ABW20_dc0100285 [Dactylellina cionopaga]|nr:hypothetical protein ABW20_dc0100285 [Dactylellina cionopaga]